MTRRKARAIGKRARPPRRRPRLRVRRRLGRWLPAVALALAVGAGLTALWSVRLSNPARVSPMLGYLTAADRQRATTPLSEDARQWLVEHRQDVRRIAAAFDVSPVALGGIVAAEKTLLTNRVDAAGDEVFRAVFGSLRDQDLERWAREQEREYRRRVERGGGRPTLLTPYLWTVGPAQVSFRLALLHEPEVARRLGRPQRNIKQVLEAVTSMPGNLEYAAALLADAQRAYADVAGIDIAREPGLLATLYQLGSPAARARRLAAGNTAREMGGAAPERPRMNGYGAFVHGHAAEIASLLGLAAVEATTLAQAASAFAGRSPAEPLLLAWRTSGAFGR